MYTKHSSPDLMAELNILKAVDSVIDDLDELLRFAESLITPKKKRTKLLSQLTVSEHRPCPSLYKATSSVFVRLLVQHPAMNPFLTLIDFVAIGSTSVKGRAAVKNSGGVAGSWAFIQQTSDVYLQSRASISFSPLKSIIVNEDPKADLTSALVGGAVLALLSPNAPQKLRRWESDFDIVQKRSKTKRTLKKLKKTCVIRVNQVVDLYIDYVDFFFF